MHRSLLLPVTITVISALQLLAPDTLPAAVAQTRKAPQPARRAASNESYEAWTDRVTKLIKVNWRPPASATNISTFVVMQCGIDASGKIVDTKLSKSSGVKSLDDSAQQAFATTRQVPAPPPLPQGVPVIGIEITFDYKATPAVARPAAPPAAPQAAAPPAKTDIETVPAGDTSPASTPASAAETTIAPSTTETPATEASPAVPATTETAPAATSETAAPATSESATPATSDGAPASTQTPTDEGEGKPVEDKFSQ